MRFRAYSFQGTSGFAKVSRGFAEFRGFANSRILWGSGGREVSISRGGGRWPIILEFYGGPGVVHVDYDFFSLYRAVYYIEGK